MTLRRTPALCEVKEKHEIAVYIFRVLSAVLSSSDVCQTLRKASCSQWRKFFHEPFPEIRYR